MTLVSMMAWRIGDILDIHRQFDWIEENGFEALSFHASSGVTGKWQGIPLADLGDGDLEILRRRLAVFKGIEVHAPFECEIGLPDQGTFEKLIQVCRAGAKIGASVVTVHSRQPGRDDVAGRNIWKEQIEALSNSLVGTTTRVGLELTGEFEILDETCAPGVGITLDVGHMYQKDINGRVPLEQSQQVGEVITGLGEKLIHLHMHDYNGTTDHIETGTGFIDFGDIFRTLQNLKYHEILCLELNPDRVSPDGILRSASFIRNGMA